MVRRTLSLLQFGNTGSGKMLDRRVVLCHRLHLLHLRAAENHVPQ